MELEVLCHPVSRLESPKPCWDKNDASTTWLWRTACVSILQQVSICETLPGRTLSRMVLFSQFCGGTEGAVIRDSNSGKVAWLVSALGWHPPVRRQGSPADRFFACTIALAPSRCPGRIDALDSWRHSTYTGGFLF